MKCLDSGYFSRSTVKPLDKIFNLEREKKLISAYLKHGEWFMVSGIRRVGKTTLIRSILENVNIQKIYINLWNIDEDKPFQDFILRLTREALSYLDKSIKNKLKSVEEVSIFGVRVKFKHEKKEFYLDELLYRITEKDKLIIVVDEIQEMEGDIKKFAKFISSLHDKLAPKLSIVILGSIASVKRLLNERISETEPIFGRIIKEFYVKPFDKIKARKFLEKGFEECNTNYKQEEIEKAVDYLGTITGWLVEFGREYTIERKEIGEVDVDNVLKTVYNQAKKIVYGEIARILKGKKRFDIYLKILKLIANTPYISLAELSKTLNRKKPTVLQYIEHLKFRNIIKSENGQYNIIDPLYRRTILTPNFETEVKKRM